MEKKQCRKNFFIHLTPLDKGSQIIVSADRAPNKLSRIQERIKSRFSGGLVVDIKKPDYELRKKLLIKKQKNLTKFILIKSKFPKKSKII